MGTRGVTWILKLSKIQINNSNTLSKRVNVDKRKNTVDMIFCTDLFDVTIVFITCDRIISGN